MELYNQAYAEIQDRHVPATYLKLINENLTFNLKDKILEIGSGTGSLSEFLKKRGINVFSLDLNHYANLISQTTRHQQESTLNIVTADANKPLPYADGEFEKIISLHTIEHIKDLQSLASELNRITAPGGKQLHVFPAPWIIKEEGALIDTLRIHKLNIPEAWRQAKLLHVHKLNPKKFEYYLEDTSLKLVKSEKVFVPEEMGRSWMIVLEKQFPDK